MHREYLVWESPSLGRRMEALRFGHAGRPYLWFPTSQGRFYQNEDFGLVGALHDRIDAGQLMVLCVDSVDAESFYAAHKSPAERMQRQDAYDRYLASEVVPWLRQRSAGARVATFGCSFGAYHAVNFAFRHPELCDKAVGFSGKYDIHGFLDGWWGDLAYFHCPTAYVPNMNQEWVDRLRSMDIAIVTGQTDNILSGSQEMIRILSERGIPHRGHVWDAPYGHDWPWWKDQVRHYLP